MLVITGAQRSGTSLMARLLKDSGYEVGSSLGDEAGELENEVVSAFYREYLGDPRFPYDDAKLPTLSEYAQIYANGWAGVFANYDCDVCKFSFLTMNPAFVYIWHKFRPPDLGDKFLIMIRDSFDIVKSKNRLAERFEHDSDLLMQNGLQIECNRKQSINLLKEFGYEFRLLNFPQCLGHINYVYNPIWMLDHNLKIQQEVWDSVVDPSKVHFK